MSSCINNYPVKHKHIASNEQLSKEMCDEQKFALSNMIWKLDIEKKGYALSECRGMVNVQLVEELHVDNRKIKEVLLPHFGDSICITYPRDKSQSQMFYLCNIAAHDIAVVRKKDGPEERCYQRLC